MSLDTLEHHQLILKISCLSFSILSCFSTLNGKVPSPTPEKKLPSKIFFFKKAFETVLNQACFTFPGGRGESKLIRSQSGRMSVGPHKYAPEKYSDRESVTPRSATLPTASRVSRRTSEVTAAHINNNNNNKILSRPNSATTNRPRSNTVNTMTSSSPRG